MEFITNIITTFSSLYIITCLLDNINETRKDLKTIKLNKEKNIAASEIIDKTNCLSNVENIYLENIDKILKELSYPKELEEIIVQFKNYIDFDNSITCINKLNDLKINHINVLNDIKKYLQNFPENEGNYTPSDNTINIYKIFDKKSVLSHEFLHMASTNKNQASGFYTNLDNIWIGDGLDEGYTELLNQRIFKVKKTSYKYNVEILKLLELFFDNPKDMEYAYFHNNIFIIYKTFLKYGTKEEFFTLLQNLDNLIETNIPIYKTVTATNTKIFLYKIIKRSKDNNKIREFQINLEKDPLIKLIKKKKQFDKNKSKQKTKK